MPLSPNSLSSALVTLKSLAEAEFQHVRADGNLVRFDYLAGPIPLACYAEINSELQACLFRATLTLPIDTDKRDRVMEFMTRVNYELAVGSWCMDVDSGEVRWKSGFFFGDAPSASLMHKLLASSQALIYRYVFGIVALVAGKSVPEAMLQIGTDHGVGRFR